MTRYFVDTEFIEDGKTIDLISIGIVCEDGRELYLQSVEFDPDKANDWVVENVFGHLSICPWAAVAGNPNDLRKFIARELHVHEQGQCLDQQRGWVHNCPWRSRIQLRHEILRFINSASDLPSFYGDYCAYDYVVLSQLFGTMMDWPQNWPMFFHDLRQEAHFKNMIDISSRIPMAETEHNALSDARWIKTSWDFLQSTNP